jgi:hypothetical protein
MNKGLLTLAICCIVFNAFSQDANVTEVKTDKLLLHFDKQKSIQFGMYGKDSVKLVLQVKAEGQLMPEIYYVKGKILGDSTGVLLNIPMDIQRKKASWIFSEYVATASNDNMFIEANEYANFSYSPFDYEFTSDPPNAEIYLVPLDEWEKIFKSDNINIQLAANQLPQLVNFNISRYTPCHYSVFEQSYVGVFMNGDKIEIRSVKPKRNTPVNNKAFINFNKTQ